LRTPQRDMLSRRREGSPRRARPDLRSRCSGSRVWPVAARGVGGACGCGRGDASEPPHPPCSVCAAWLIPSPEIVFEAVLHQADGNYVLPLLSRDLRSDVGALEERECVAVLALRAARLVVAITGRLVHRSGGSSDADKEAGLRGLAVIAAVADGVPSSGGCRTTATSARC